MKTLFSSQLKTILYSIALMFLAKTSYAQTDTVFTNTQKIACVVKEITPEVVKYVYPGEDVLNSVYRNSVQKIAFKSGRIQIFEQAKAYKIVKSVRDLDSVEITSLETDIKGLYKMGEVNAKAKGTTIYSSPTHVRERAFKKNKKRSRYNGRQYYIDDQSAK